MFSRNNPLEKLQYQAVKNLLYQQTLLSYHYDNNSDLSPLRLPTARCTKSVTILIYTVTGIPLMEKRAVKMLYYIQAFP